MSSIHTIPFITQGILFRDDCVQTGSYSIGSSFNGSIVSYSTDGDILTINASGSPNGYASIIINTVPVTANSFAFRAKLGSGMNVSGKCDLILYSGSTSQLFSIANTDFVVLTGSTINLTSTSAEYSASDYSFLDYFTLGGVVITNNYIDKIEFRLEGLSNSCSSQFDFVQLYQQNFPFRYVKNQAKFDLKRRIAELDVPGRDQGIIQSLGSHSPVLELDGVFVNDMDFTAQSYRDNLLSIYNEKNYQWVYTNLIEQKFYPEDISLTEIAGITNYYPYNIRLREFTLISATSGSVYGILTPTGSAPILLHTFRWNDGTTWNDAGVWS